MSKCRLALVWFVLSVSAFANPSLSLYTMMAPLSIGIVGGEAHTGVNPVAGFFRARLDSSGRITSTAPFCSGTLLEGDVILTATHCFVGFLNRDGSLRLPPNTQIIAVFEQGGYAANKPYFPVTGVYHQFPAVGSKAFVGWSAYVRSIPATRSMERISANDVALVKLANTAALRGYVAPARLANYRSADRTDLRVSGYGISRTGLAAAVAGDGAGSRRLIAIQETRGFAGTTSLVSGLIPRATDSPESYIGVHHGDSGGFVGLIEKNSDKTKPEQFTVEGITLSKSNPRPGDTTPVPFRFRPVTDSLSQWIDRGRRALNDLPNDGFHALSAPHTDLNDIRIAELGRNILPPWRIEASPFEKVATQYELDWTKATIRTDEMRSDSPGIDKLRAVVVIAPGKWHGERFTTAIPLGMKTKASMERLESALKEHLATKGLPECLRRDPMGLVLATGDSRFLAFLSTLEWRPGTSFPNGRPVAEPGYTSCEDVEEIYPDDLPGCG